MVSVRATRAMPNEPPMCRAPGMSSLPNVPASAVGPNVQPVQLDSPRNQPITVSTRMPISMAPLTLRACSTAISTIPARVSRAVGVFRLPSATVVAGLATTSPAFFRPMKAMNRPMPAAVAASRGLGIERTISWRTPTSVSSRKAIPEMKTQPSAVSHGTPMPLTTV